MQGWIFITLVIIGSLFALTGLRQLVFEPLAGTGPNIVWLIIQVLPLLAVVPGVLTKHINSYFFTIVVAMMYFVHGVMVAATEPLRWLGLIEVVFSLALVTVATYLLRRLRAEGGH